MPRQTSGGEASRTSAKDCRELQLGLALHRDSGDMPRAEAARANLTAGLNLLNIALADQALKHAVSGVTADTTPSGRDMNELVSEATADVTRALAALESE